MISETGNVTGNDAGNGTYPGILLIRVERKMEK